MKKISKYNKNMVPLIVHPITNINVGVLRTHNRNHIFKLENLIPKEGVLNPYKNPLMRFSNNKRGDVALDNFGITVLAVILFIALIAVVIIMMTRALN